MASFFRSFLFFLAIVVIVLVVLSKVVTESYINSVTWGILAYFAILTSAFQYGLALASKGKPQQFVRYYMSATSFKLLIHLIVLIVYCLFHKSDAVRFIISFAIFYFVFTMFEFMAVKRSFKK